MASVFDVAKYILETRGRMSTMKLQKLCYYCQAWSLVWDDCELFPEGFEAWANGPVCRELYNATKGILVSSQVMKMGTAIISQKIKKILSIMCLNTTLRIMLNGLAS